MKHLKIILITLFSFFVVLELAFNFILPNVIKLDKFKPMLLDMIKEQAQLTLDYDSAKIVTTPLFGIGIKVDNISLKLPDKSLLFSADSIKTRIALPSILMMTVKVSCLDVKKPFLNVEIVNNENYKVVKLVQDIVNNQKMQKLENPLPPKKNAFEFNPAWIRIKLPNAKLSDYKIKIIDLKSGHSLSLYGNEMVLGYFNGNRAKLRTVAQLDSDNNKNITLDANISTVLPKLKDNLDKEDDEPERMDIPFVNPVTMYRIYDLKTDIKTKLNIRGNDKYGYTSYGFINISDLTVKLGNKLLPPNYLTLNTFGKNVEINSDLNIKDDQSVKLLGKLKYGNNPKMDMVVRTDKIYFNDLILLSKAVLDSLAIPNELNTVSANGFFEADAYIKTNFKKLKSNGHIIVKNGALKIRNLGEIVSKANINLLFDDNMLNIDNSSIYLNNSNISLKGNINNKNIANINIVSDRISLPKLFLAFSPKEFRNTYNFVSGFLTFDFSVKGKLKNPKISAVVSLDNMNLNDKKRTFKLLNGKTLLTFDIIKHKLSALLSNDNLLVELPATKSKISLPNISVCLKDNNVAINENSLFLNDKTKINYRGNIVDYVKLKNIDISADSSISTSDLIKFIGMDYAKFISNSGALPFEFSISGNANKITLASKIYADMNNFFTPIVFKELQSKNTVAQAIIDIKPNRIKIKETGIFDKVVTKDKHGREHVHLADILRVNGTIAGDNINVLRINIPKSLNGKFYVFPKSSFVLNRCYTFVMGRMSNPRALGNIALSHVNIPELFLSVDSIIVRIKGLMANFRLHNVNANNSHFEIKGALNMLSMPFELSNLTVNSNILDVDKLMKVSDKLMTYMPQPSQKTPPVSNQSADIPVKINNGNVNIKILKTGNIKVENINSNISLDKNVFYLTNLKANVFDGKTSGNISVNLINTLLNIDMNGNNINVNKALVDAANMKNTLSGKCVFDAKLSLKGTTYEEQMSSMKGKVGFTIKDGQFGPFGKLENLIIAENIRESEFFKSALGGVINSLATIDTTHFSDLSGVLNFENGICHIDDLTSQGRVLALHIFGDFNILRNYADMKVRAKMTSVINNLLGPIAMINPVNIMNSAAGLNVVTAKAFSLFCETVPDAEIKKLPPFSNNYVDSAATKFQLVVRGDAAKPLTLVKSFKWLATQVEFNRANEFVASIPESVDGDPAITVQQLLEEKKQLEAEKKTFKYKLIHVFIPKKHK